MTTTEPNPDDLPPKPEIEDMPPKKGVEPPDKGEQLADNDFMTEQDAADDDTIDNEENIR